MTHAKRLLTRLAIAALCGMLLTLASAWLPSAFLDIKTGKLHNLEYEPPLEIPAYINAPKDWHIRTWHTCWGPGLRYDLISESQWMGSTIGSSPSTAPNRTILRITAGFPIPCMRWTPFAAGDLPESHSRNPWYTGLDLPGKQLLGQHVERALPLFPVFWPTLINVVIYSVTSFILLMAAIAIRTTFRRRRALCTACGYAVGNLPRCPECGHASTSPAPDRRPPEPSPAHPPASAP